MRGHLGGNERDGWRRRDGWEMASRVFAVERNANGNGGLMAFVRLYSIGKVCVLYPAFSHRSITQLGVLPSRPPNASLALLLGAGRHSGRTRSPSLHWSWIHTEAGPSLVSPPPPLPVHSPSSRPSLSTLAVDPLLHTTTHHPHRRRPHTDSMSLSTRRPAAGRSTASFFSFTLAAAVILSLVSSASALPTLRQARDAVAPESLFRRAAPHVGPARPVERLRLRRNLESVPHGRRNAENASLRPAVPVTAGAVNPKRAKRDDVVAAAGARASNPKLKRASVDTGVVRAANLKAKRAVQSTEPEPEQHFVNIARRAAGLPAVVLNPKKRSLEKRAVVEATISVSPSPSRAASKRSVKRSLMDRVRRFLAARATSTDSSGGPVLSPDVHRMILAVPNPKSPNFPGNGGGSSSSSSAAPSTTTSRASSTTTSQPASTTTSKPVTTTTSKPVTTTTTTTSAAPSATVSPDEKMLSGGYYTAWGIDTLPPSKVNYAMFDIINFGKLSSPVSRVQHFDWGTD